MNLKPSNDSTTEKRRQNMQLIVLLILVAGFAYLYFFTGLIKPQAPQTPVEAPAPQTVKMPLPPHDGKPAFDTRSSVPGVHGNGASPAKPEPRKPEKGVSATEPLKIEPAKAVKSAATEKKAATAETKKTIPEAKEQKNAATAKQPPAMAVKKVATAKENDTAVKAVAKTPAKPVSPLKKQAAAPSPHNKKTASAVPSAENGLWTVVVGRYALEEALAADLARVKGAGVEVSVQDGGRSKTAMNRLLAGEYPTRADAKKEIEVLQRFTPDAFILEQNGRYSVYAGSYLLMERATAEKERLSAAKISLTIKHAEVSIPMKCLIAGTFNDKKVAEKTINKLKNAGLKPVLSRQ